MKPHLTILLCGALAIAADAQTASPSASPNGSPASPSSATPDASTAPTASASADSSQQPASREQPSPGYAALLEAGNLILPGENGAPSAAEILAPDENLRRQRLAVTRNAPALARLREALQLPYSTPLATDYAALTPSPYGKYRELARQLIQESAVRAADGDAFGAVLSRLDCLELGVTVSRGPIISQLVGVAVEAIARGGIESLAANLDAPQSRLVAERMRRIEAKRPPFDQIVRLEGEQTLQLTLSTLPDAAARAELLTPEGRNKREASEKEAREFLSLTPERVRADNIRLFTTASAAARVSPRLAAMVPLPRDLNPSTNLSRDILARPSVRFSYERSVAQNRLLLSALELHAQRLETGAYPPQFSAPRDPFSPENPLIYRLDGDKYLLYSVGPDARDDRGRAIRPELVYFDGDSGQTRVVKTRGFNASNKGDIVAPVF